MVRTRTSDFRLKKSALVDNFLFERRALRAERSTIDRMVGIALNMHDLRCHIFGFIAKCVNDYAAAYRAIRTSAASLSSAGDFESLSLRVHGREIETESRNARAANQCRLNEGSS